MSRTYNHRPQWVKFNDPKFPTRERHQHYEIKREKSGKVIPYTVHRWVGPPEYTVPEERYRDHYYQWVENVPCTIDLPHVSWTRERQQVRSNTYKKLCDKRELYNKGCPCCTRQEHKATFNRAIRGKINQQLHEAVRDHGWTADADEWYDVDITEKHKKFNEWWD